MKMRKYFLLVKKYRLSLSPSGYGIAFDDQKPFYETYTDGRFRRYGLPKAFH